MDATTTSYRAFLLRVWAQPKRSSIHASVQDVESGEKRTFASLDGLHAWLDREMESAAPCDLRSDQPDT